MSLEKISSQLNSSDGDSPQKLPPVELWDPPYCGEINLEIKADGHWFYNGTSFKRLNLVKLFASVLKKEADDYFLVTPQEKVKITVEDVPFVLTQWQWGPDGVNSEMLVTTNLGDEFLLDQQHPLTIDESGCLYVLVRRNLLAKVHRNVFYQWVDLAQTRQTGAVTELVLDCGEQQLVLGTI